MTINVRLKLRLLMRQYQPMEYFLNIKQQGNTMLIIDKKYQKRLILSLET
jgi:hypothetical protein